MCIFCDLKNSFSGLSSFASETQINNQFSNVINMTCTKSVREVPYFGGYFGRLQKYKCKGCLVQSCQTFKADSWMPTCVDISLMGRGSNCKPELWLIEAKHLGDVSGNTTEFTEHDLAVCASHNTTLDMLTYNSGGNIFLTGRYDGVIWVDICRLLEIYSHCKKTAPKPRLFQAFYVHNTNSNFTTKVVDIYDEYTYALRYLGDVFGDYVITKGIGTNPDYHAWEIHPVQNFVYYQHNSGCASLQQTIITNQPIKPFCSANGYDLYLIEIIPKTRKAKSL